jgi:MFS family permease
MSPPRLYYASKSIETGRFSPNLRSFQSKPFVVGNANTRRDHRARRERAVTLLDQTGDLSGLSTLKRSGSVTVWAAMVSACAAWMFDAMDLQIFTLVLFPSVSEFLGTANPGVVAYAGGIIVGGKLLALGLGGIMFGIAADRFGRARIMIVTVLIYSVFTGLSGLAQSAWQLAILQALAGIGIGGEWAAGAALIAETWPERTRARALIIMQMCFAAGFFLAAAINLVIGPTGWRYVFTAGAVPALITLFVRLFVREPQRWIAVRDQRLSNGTEGVFTSLMNLFGHGIRRNTIVGLLVAVSMMIGAFGGATLLPVWIRGLVGADAKLALIVTSRCFMLMNVGGVLGYLAVMWLSDAIGRRWCYFLMALGGATANLFIFTQIGTVHDLLWFAPIFGFFVVGGFGTFAVYLPELFPTRNRATGQGFCWNAARILTAAGPIATGAFVNALGSAAAAGATMTAIYFVGLVAIWLGPETRGLPLQD